MKPTRIIYLLHLPIKIVRFITDPIVDGILWFIRPAATHFFRVFGEVLKLRATESETSQLNPELFYEHAIKRLEQFLPFLARFSSARPPPVESAPSLFSIPRAYIVAHAAPLMSQISAKIFGAAPTAIPDAPSRFQEMWTSLSANWYQLAVHNGEDERLFAIALGYATVAFVLGLFVASGSILNGTTRFVRSFVAQQVVVLKVRVFSMLGFHRRLMSSFIKVAMFIIIELAIFPFGCGVFLDLSTLPLFPDASISSRLQYCATSPISALFFHWMLGTMCAYLIRHSMAREITEFLRFYQSCINLRWCSRLPDLS